MLFLQLAANLCRLTSHNMEDFLGKAAKTQTTYRWEKHYYVEHFLWSILLSSLQAGAPWFTKYTSGNLTILSSYFEKTAIKTSYSISRGVNVDFRNLTGSPRYGLCLENGDDQLNGSKLQLGPLTSLIGEALLSLDPTLCKSTRQVCL